jgi:CII-binding regulator of phage lambda lysogenization HflD
MQVERLSWLKDKGADGYWPIEKLMEQYYKNKKSYLSTLDSLYRLACSTQGSQIKATGSPCWYVFESVALIS